MSNINYKSQRDYQIIGGSRGAALGVRLSFGTRILHFHANLLVTFTNFWRTPLHLNPSVSRGQLQCSPGAFSIEGPIVANPGALFHLLRMMCSDFILCYVGIQYGAEAYFIFEDRVDDMSDKQIVQGSLRATINKIPTIFHRRTR